MVNQKKQLEEIMMLDFAVCDITLFLDTHPCDQEAFNYYKEACMRLEKSTAAYQKEYGPLNNRTITTNQYEYVSTPWPWEGKI